MAWLANPSPASGKPETQQGRPAEVLVQGENHTRSSARNACARARAHFLLFSCTRFSFSLVVSLSILLTRFFLFFFCRWCARHWTRGLHWSSRATSRRKSSISPLRASDWQCRANTTPRKSSLRWWPWQASFAKCAPAQPKVCHSSLAPQPSPGGLTF
jgi:hypothetical protein